MTGFDIIVLLIVGIAGAGGFIRGFVQEVLSLFAWILAIFAINQLHTPLAATIEPYVGTANGAAVLAFALLLLIPYFAMKLIAGRVGEASRNSIIGPIDRLLGFGFGIIKGAIIVVIGFSMLVLGYDTIWGVAGRPSWMTTARTYPFVDASADELVEMIDERRARLKAERDAANGD